jgi:hypothetical protein
MDNTEKAQRIVAAINNFIAESRRSADLFHASYIHWMDDYIERMKAELDPVFKELAGTGKDTDEPVGGS